MEEKSGVGELKQSSKMKSKSRISKKASKMSVGSRTKQSKITNMGSGRLVSPGSHQNTGREAQFALIQARLDLMD